MKKWFRKIFRKPGSLPYGKRIKNGVPPGREKFARSNNGDGRQKKSLLKKLNLYWSQKKATSRSGYSQSPQRSGWRRKIVLIFFLIISASLFWKTGGIQSTTLLLENLDYFRIAAIEVQGCVNASAEQVRTSSGIAVSTSQFSVDTDRVIHGIKRENNWVKDVQISRHWPDRLVIEVDEYKPHALIAVASNGTAALHYLDRSGEPFVRAETGMDLDYPVITGLESEGDNNAVSDKLKQPLYFLHLVGGNNPNLPAQSVSEIHIDTDEGLVVYLVEYPFPIFLGKDDIRKKYVRLRRILEVLYKPRKMGMDIARVAYIRMDYLKDKAIVGYSESG